MDINTHSKTCRFSLRHLILLVGLIFIHPWGFANAGNTELGFNYQYKRTTIDSLNSIEQQGISGTVALYFFESLATELSYTNSTYVKREKADSLSTSTATRTTTQIADIYGLDLIYVLSGRKSPFQPFIKGGLAHIRKKQFYIQDAETWDSGWVTGWGPSYGLGFKFFLTQATAIRTSWEVVRTPIDSSAYADDQSIRIGLSWML